MKKLLSYLWGLSKFLLLLLIILTAIGWYRAPTAPANPNLNLISVNNHALDLQKMSKNRPLLIYFWGSWCSVCSITSPSIQELHEDGYNVVTIAVSSGSDEQVKQYLNTHQYTFTTINDPNGRIFRDWSGRVTPSFVILQDGIMKQGLSGVQASWSLKVRLWLNQFL
ncbi:Cytochrome c biogenesis protein CcmG [Phocoenobacter uteri]|uniref:Cytochrome c biogenesis protein CcmG n=1 Tax=Phocoenobacter uteri TaxID=146806 RepID=A0A379C9E3_9PAST|nr:protein disulfide oxidoreductase [Phocoenobacter uteri]MDG6882763.1 hypothetical protein [Phocoenobacter uteri]SUB58930.1 Cytochrome c biogenesis protein CcmG [Phocoenobacter uteri]